MRRPPLLSPERWLPGRWRAVTALVKGPPPAGTDQQPAGTEQPPATAGTPPAALPWAVAAAGLVFPVAVHEHHYRYVVSVVPVACLAAGLAFAGRQATATEAVIPGQAAPRPWQDVKL